MNHFTYLKNNCPVCVGKRKDCRKAGDLYFCRGDIPNPDFNFKKFDANGFGIYILASLEAEQSEEEREKRRQEWEQEKQRRIAENARSLSIEECDCEIRKILSQILLSEVHRQDLKRRGLSDEQIKRGMFCSILPFQKLQYPVSDRLAGVSIGGRSLSNIDEGYICPAWNSEGLIIGWQLRTAKAESKYKWATSKWWKRLNGPTSKLQNGEMPITVCRPETCQADLGIGLAEGILKPWVAATLSHQIFIGASGGNFASSPQQLKAELDKLSEELGTKRVVLYPDAGAVNNTNVMGAYRKTYRLLKEWKYDLAIGWWGQEYEDREKGIDDLLAAGAGKGNEIDYLYFEDWERINNQRRRSGNSFNQFFKQVFATVKAVFKGFGKRNEKLKLAGKREKFLLPNEKPIEYQAGERRNATVAAAKRRQFIFDSSAPGTGKSYDAGLYKPEDFGCDRIIYVSAQHRNVTTPSLASWEDLESRHKGLYQDNFGNWKRATKEQPRETSPTCDRTETIGVLREKNIKGADTTGLVCPTCPQFESCLSGNKFGFLHMRSNTLKAERFRAHPDSLPSPSNYPYAAAMDEEEGGNKGTVLIWEEWSEILRFCRHITISANDVEHTVANIMSADFNCGFGLADALIKLWEFLSGKHPIPKWGFPHAEVLKILAPLLKVEDIDLEAIASVTNPGEQVQQILHGLSEHGISLSDLNVGMRKQFAKKDEELAEQAQTIAKQWLIPFLGVVLGHSKGYLHLENGKLTVTIPDRRLIEIAHSARANIFLDATGDTEKLAAILKIDRQNIAHIRQVQQAGAKVKIQQILGLGRLGMNQTPEQQKKVAILIDKLQPEIVIAPKKHSRELDFLWFTSGSRGGNLGEKAQSLAVVGSPCRPIGILAAEFAVLNGYAPTLKTEPQQRQVTQTEATSKKCFITSKESVDKKFCEYVRSDTLATIEQGFGRLRAERRSGECLTIYFLGDFCLDRPVKVVRAIDISPEAGTAIEQLERAIAQFAKKAAASGKKLTLTAIADYCGVCKQRISQLIRELGWPTWEAFKKRLVSLVSPTSKTRQTKSVIGTNGSESGTEYISLSAEKEIECMTAHIGVFPFSVTVNLLEAAGYHFDDSLKPKSPLQGQAQQRRGWDLNPRNLSAHSISSRAHSTTLPPLQAHRFYHTSNCR